MIEKNNIFTLCQLNIDGLSQHSAIATDKFIGENSVDILALQEIGKTAPPIDVFSGMLTYGGNNIRGVSLSVAKNHYPQHVPELEDSNVDAVFTLCTIKKLPILVASCYCRPEIASTKSLKSLLSLISKAWVWCKGSKVKSMLIMGDFNARSINWGDSIDNPRGKVLSEFIESTSEARLHSTGRNTFLHSKGGSVIDLSISFGQVSSLLSTPYTEHCYTLFTGAPHKGHIPVIQNLVTETTPTKSKQTVFNYDKADWDKWSDELNGACEYALSTNKNAKELFSGLQNAIDDCNRRNVPLKTVCEHSKPFWCDNLTKLSVALQNANVKYKNRSDPANKKELEKTRDEFQNALIFEKNCWIHSQLEGLNTHESIEFWKRYKRQFVQKEVNYIGHLYKDNKSNILLTEESLKEEALYHSFFTGEHLKEYLFDEEHYAMINKEIDELRETNWGISEESFKHPKTDQSESLLQTNSEGYGSEFLSCEISLNEVQEAIQAQKTSGKCCDKDGFHPILLKKLPIYAIKLLTHLYNMVLKTGDWIWNSSLVTFIRKANKNSYLLPGSYRPLTLSSYIGKIMERVLQKRLIIYCQQNGVIDNAQEGFLPKRNTSRYLYQMTSSIMEARRRKLQAMILLIDFQKAFDSVPVSSMIFKLRQNGINGIFLKLINSFLSSGSINIKVNEYVGPKRSTGKYGLPQGSVLSPILFIIYVSDLLVMQSLPKQVMEWATAFKYADDGSVLITGKDTVECYDKMQHICHYLTAWCFKWRLAINCDKDKTEAIIIKTKISQNTMILQKLNISGKEIEFVSKSRVLGVTIDEELNFLSHAKTTLSACWNVWHKLSDKTTRKRGLNCSTLTILFKTAVLTKLLYAAPIWLNNNKCIFDDFFARAMLKITGSQFYAPNAISQVLLNLPPLALLFEMIVVKFYLKSLSQDDDVKSLIMQLEETPGHPFYQHVMWMKNYILWRRDDCKLTRSVALTDLLPRDLQYTKSLVVSYQSKKWDTMILNNYMKFFIEDDENGIIEDAHMKMIKTESLSLVPIFLREDSRVDNTNMLDFFHGRCLRFKDFKSSVMKDKSINNMLCLDCGKETDSPKHKLFFCDAFEGEHRNNLITKIEENDITAYLVKVIFSTDRDIKTSFKIQVRNICSTSHFDDEYKPTLPT